MLFIPKEDIRYLLQVTAHHQINILPNEYIDLLNNVTSLCVDSEPLKKSIKSILSDLSLHYIIPRSGTVLESVKKCLIPQNVSLDDNYQITYRCVDRSIYPQIIKRPVNNSGQAVIFIDNLIFRGFEKDHFNYLKDELKIEYIKIIYRDYNGQKIIISDGYEPLSNYLKIVEFSRGIEFDITKRPVVIFLIILSVIIIIMTPKIIR